METTVELPFNPPYHWESLVRSMTPKMTAGVEAIGPDSYRRTIAIGGRHGLLEVRPVEGRHHLLARINLPDAALVGPVVERLRAMFDLDADVAAIGGGLAGDPYLRAAVAATPGLRIPGAWDPFELSVRTILGQQISVLAATTLAGRIAAAYGEPLRDAEPTAELRFVFPSPAALAAADLGPLGVFRTRAAAISAVAAAFAGDPDLLLRFASLDELVAELCKLPGVGEWTAHYIALRALRQADAFPASDLGLLRAMETFEQPMTKGRLLALAERWRPWRGYAAMYLWSMLPPIIRKK